MNEHGLVTLFLVLGSLYFFASIIDIFIWWSKEKGEPL